MADLQLVVRRINYDELAYLAARAEAAMDNDDIDAAIKWGIEFHELRELLESL